MIKMFSNLPRLSQYCSLGILILVIGNLSMRTTSHFSSDFKLVSMLLDWAILIPVLVYLGFHRNGLLKRISLSLIIWSAVVSAFFLTNNDSVLKSLFMEYYFYLVTISAVAGFSYSIIAITYYSIYSVNLRGEDRLFYIAKKAFGGKRMGQLITGEWLGLYYFIYGWKASPEPKQSQFTYHKNSSMKSVFAVVTVLTLLEVIAVHLVASIWSEKLAWIITTITLYFFYVIPAHLNAMKHRFISLSNNQLKLRNGLMITADIDYNNILNAQTILVSNPKATDRSSLRAQLYDHANVLIELKSEQTIPLIAGFTKTTSTITVMLDEPSQFINELNKMRGVGLS